MKNRENGIYDVIIIGAGCVGCAIARELSRYLPDIAVLEKEYDVGSGTSGRNSAVVHAGFNNKTGSLMAKLCVEGNTGFEAVCRELDVPYKKTGKLIVAFTEEEIDTLKKLKEQGERNGCRGLRMLGGEELHRQAPGIGGIAAMESPETAIINPFLYTVALAENAAVNGADFYFNHEVTAIKKADGLFVVATGKGEFYARHLINCAGLFSDRISGMAGAADYEIHPCRGEYLILDKIASRLLNLPVYPAPVKGSGGLGVHLTPTIEGNILIGPSAEYLDEKDDYASTADVSDELFEEAKKLLPALERHQVIGMFSGIRPKLTPKNEGGFRDFVIRREESPPGLINLIGIESPGLTASIPIARMVCAMLGESVKLTPRPDFNPVRKGIMRFRDLPPLEQGKLIEQDPDYGEIVCRCQNITKKEIKQAIENPLNTCTMSGIKARTWATTGRCQGGYCLTRITQILTEDYGLSPEQITKCGDGSPLYVGRVK